MKKVTTLFVIFLCFAVKSYADDTRYVNTMKNNISQIDSLKTLDSIIDLKNSFLRIANVEKNKWLPFYYVSYLYIITSFADTVKSKKDGYLDEALKFLAVADSLQPNESEIYVLKGLISQARLQIDPMNRFMKYGASMHASFQKAMELDPKNPRPEYLMGMTLFYTPEQFGGGPKLAKPMFENSLKKFNEYVPKEELMPSWGRKEVERFLKQIPQ